MFDGKPVCRLAWLGGSSAHTTGSMLFLQAMACWSSLASGMARPSFRRGARLTWPPVSPGPTLHLPMDSGTENLNQHLFAVCYADLSCLACRFVQSEAFKYFQQHGRVKYSEFATGPPTLQSLATVLGGMLGEQPGLSKANVFKESMASLLALLHPRADSTKAFALCN